MARTRRRRDSDEVWGATMFSPFIDVVMNGFAAIVVILCLFIIFSGKPEPPIPIRFVHTLSGPLRLVAEAGFAHVLSVRNGRGERTFTLTQRDGAPLPGWVTLDQLGVAYGNAKPHDGPLRLTATVKDATGSDRMDFDVEVLPTAIPWTLGAPLALSTTKSDLPPARAGVPYEVVLGATGGVPPLTWNASPTRASSGEVGVRIPGGEIQSAPTGAAILLDGRDTGLTFADGRITGTPTEAGSIAIDVEVTHSPGRWQHGEVERTWTGARVTGRYSLQVLGAIALTVETTPVRERDRALLAVCASDLLPGETLRWTGLPAGLTPRDDGRVVTGSVATHGRYAVRVEVVAGERVLAHAEGELVVLPRLPDTVAPIVFQAWVGELCEYAVPYRGRLEPVQITLASGDLPQGLELVDGAIRGKPTETGLFSVSLQLADAAGVSTTLGVTLRVGNRF